MEFPSLPNWKSCLLTCRRRFSLRSEFISNSWNTATDELLNETAPPEDVDDDIVVPALRVKFEGALAIEADEFRAETFFARPPVDDEARRVKVTLAEKRQFGFIYLRAP